jgi:hypothetical protein
MPMESFNLQAALRQHAGEVSKNTGPHADALRLAG